MSRLEWILSGLLAILLIAVIALGLILWLQPDTADLPPPDISGAAVGPAGTGSQQTALLALNPARDAARQWQPDAELLSVSATWPRGASRDMLTDGMASWTFSFYSAAAETVASFSVIDGRANLMTQGPPVDPAAVQTIGGWTVDSQDAIRIMLEQGGEELLQREPDAASLTMTLSADPQTGEPQWFVSLIGQRPDQAVTVWIDANSGETVAPQPAS